MAAVCHSTHFNFVYWIVVASSSLPNNLALTYNYESVISSRLLLLI